MRSGWAASVISAAAGMAILAGTTARWVVETGSRQVGGVDIAEVEAVTGVELRPGLLVAGLALILAAVPLGLIRGRARRTVGALAIVAGAAGSAVAVATLVDAAAMPGTLQPSGWLVLAGCIAGTAGGWLAVRRPDRAASLPPRFEQPPGDGGASRRAATDPVAMTADEWDRAADDSDER